MPVMQKNLKVLGFSIIAAMGGLLFGLNTAVISGAERDIQKLFELTDWWHGFTVAIALIGSIVGAIFAGWPSEKYGQKKTIILIALLFGLSSLGSGLTPNWPLLIIFRFIGGVAIGASSVIGPMYIAEISPASSRGRLVALFQLNVVVGIILAFVSNYFLASVGPDSWRWMLGIMAIPSFVFLGLSVLIPESPRWLVKHNRREEAQKVLVLCGRTDSEKEIHDIVQSFNATVDSVSEGLFSRKFFRPILYAVLLAAFNQLSGINAIMYYAPRIFEMTGLGTGTSLFQTIIIGATNVVFTILAMSIIDRYGRRTLMLFGSVGLTIFLGLIARAFLLQQFEGSSVLWFLIGNQIFFALSQGTVIWVFISEIFPNSVRAKGQSLGSFTHWVGASAISWLFPVAANSLTIGPGKAFLFFAVMMFLQLLFAWKLMPETKGKSLEQIQKDLGIK